MWQSFFLPHLVLKTAVCLVLVLLIIYLTYCKLREIIEENFIIHTLEMQQSNYGKFKAVQLSFRFFRCVHQTCGRWFVHTDSYLVNDITIIWSDLMTSPPNSGQGLWSKTAFHLWSCFHLTQIYKLLWCFYLVLMSHSVLGGNFSWRHHLSAAE